MDRKIQLEQCKICTKKDFDLQKGIFCSLSGDQEDFKGKCPHFSEKKHRYIAVEEKEDRSFEAIGQLIKRMFKERFVATPILIVTCIVLYLIMVTQSDYLLVPDDKTLFKFGANTKPYTIYGDYWRLFTAVLLHSNLDHLVANMMALFSVGFLLERVVGNLRMGLIFLITGLAASAVSILFNDINTSVGASGAIFGMFGVYIILLTTNIMDKQTRKIILICLVVYVVYSILSGLSPGIDVGAHLGGLGSGLILGLALRSSFIDNKRRFLNGFFFGSAGVLTLALVFLIVVRAPNVENRFYRILIDFSVEETKALNMYEKYYNRKISSSRRMIIGNVVPTFRKCKRLVNEAGDLEGLPEEYVQKAELISEYCDYSIRQFENTVLIRQNGYDRYEYLQQYIIGRREYLMMKIRDTTYTDTLFSSVPMRDILNDIPDSVLLVLDGWPELTRSEIQDYNPLDLNGIMWRTPYLTERIYGQRGKNGAYFIETREAAIRRVQDMADGKPKDELLQIYGLKKIE